ncbi:MAG: hypothetical protein VYA84_21400 [Planctomycetota bacterium]|nr:hypothetical protein [Planctomycetota bacterium]
MLTENSETLARPGENRRILLSALRIEWIGQTVASLCWIGSVMSYGISSIGDWLQLVAASAWLLANIAAISTFEANEKVDRNANA